MKTFFKFPLKTFDFAVFKGVKWVCNGKAMASWSFLLGAFFIIMATAAETSLKYFGYYLGQWGLKGFVALFLLMENKIQKEILLWNLLPNCLEVWYLTIEL